MPDHPPPSNHPRRRRNTLRWLIYSVLVIWTADYYLMHPASITHEDLPPAPPELKELTDRLSRHVHTLASPELKGRQSGTAGNRAAEKYLLNAFAELKLSTPASQQRRTQEVDPAIGNNVFSALAPIHPSRPWIVLGAHFDHLGDHDGELFLGADDNASSVAVLLETARRLQQGPALQRFNVLLVGFNSEEPPHFLTHLMGSNQFMMRIKEVGIARTDIQLAVIMDLMGGVSWQPLQDTLFAVGSEKTAVLETLIPKIRVPGLDVRRLGIHMVESVPGNGQTPFSDYDAFRNRGIPFLFLSSGRTPHYHRSTDTSEKLHYARMARSVLWLTEWVRAVDALPVPMTFQKDRENLRQDFDSIYPLVREAARWPGKIAKTSWVSLYKLNRDQTRLEDIQVKLQSQTPLDADDRRALSLASIRLQCLLGDMGLCFLLPGF